MLVLETSSMDVNCVTAQSSQIKMSPLQCLALIDEVGPPCQLSQFLVNHYQLSSFRLTLLW